MHNKSLLKKTTFFLVLTAALAACKSKGGDKPAQGTPTFSVFSAEKKSVKLYSEYPATLQGEENVEIRSKVDGFVDHIYIDEGATVKKGQLLFRISAPQYQEAANNAAAAVSSAQADVSAAQLQVNKARPLVQKGIISKYELESAEYTLSSRQSALAQARANLANANINVGYTMIKSPVDGVVGLLPFKVGSLVSATTAQPLTTVSNIKNVFAYFSMNEKQLLDFSRNVPGKTAEEKLKNSPPVQLVLADGSVYPDAGKMQTIGGQLNTQTGSASFRAVFPNPMGLLRSGGSATLRISQDVPETIVIPQKATYELQGKRFVYAVAANNTIRSVEVEVMKLPAGQFFVVTSGISAGDKIIYEAPANLQDGMKIKPSMLTSEQTYNGL